jgi:tetratricopeptide (TPR) repeat protein
MRKIIFFFLLISFFSLQSAWADTSLDLYHKANIAYQKMDYPAAVSLYEQLIKTGNISADVYYNLGNAYFKNGNAPRAILNYERAKKLNPEDEDINFNLKIASLKVMDKMDVIPEVFYKRWIRAIAMSFPSNTWTTLFIILVWFLFGAAAFYMTGQTSALKKISFVLIMVFAFLSVSSFVFAKKRYAISRQEKQSIIITPSVYIKSSPDEKGNDLFILHEGTKVDVLDELNGWDKIRIANGTIGWMKSTDLENI